MRSTLSALLTMLLSVLLLSGCGSPALPEGGDEMRYARWLRMDDSVATVLSPWRDGEVLGEYPLRAAHHIVSQTSLHAWLGWHLGAAARLTGVMDADYVVAPEVRAAIAPEDGGPQTADKVVLLDMGSSVSPNVERLKTAGCDLILASPFENAGYGALETVGVPIVACADYLEPHPLGRAEWMRLYGHLFGEPSRADSLFAAEDSAYHALVTSLTPPASNATHGSHPTVLYGLRQGQSWYVPGGGSYMGRLLADAGADYVFADEGATGSVPLDFETVYAHARDAEVWIFTYATPVGSDGQCAPMTLADLAAQDARYREFRAFREHSVWACNTLAVPYYDVLPWQPAAFLRELITILHPELHPDHPLQYFHRLQ